MNKIAQFYIHEMNGWSAHLISFLFFYFSFFYFFFDVIFVFPSSLCVQCVENNEKNPATHRARLVVGRANLHN